MKEKVTFKITTTIDGIFEAENKEALEKVKKEYTSELTKVLKDTCEEFGEDFSRRFNSVKTSWESKTWETSDDWSTCEYQRTYTPTEFKL